MESKNSKPISEMTVDDLDFLINKHRSRIEPEHLAAFVKNLEMDMGSEKDGKST